MLKSSKVDRYLTWILFGLIMVLIPTFYLHHRVNGFVLMVIIIAGVFQFVLKPASYKELKTILLMPLLFLVLIIGQIYTVDLTTGWTLIERSLSILLVPFALYGSKNLDVKQENLIIRLWVLCAFLASIYCLIMQGIAAIDAGSIFTTPLSNHFSYNFFMHHRLSAPLGMHAVYFSAFIALANIYLFDKFFKSKDRFKGKIASVFLILFFTAMIFLLKSAIISFSFAVSVILITTSQLKKQSGNKMKFILVGILLVALIFAFFGVQTKMEFINLNYDMTDQHMGMLAIRLSIWENAFHVIRSNWLLGVGTGDADTALLNQYYASKFEIGFTNDYNCHNMYLQYWLGNGLLGVGLFASYFIVLAKKAASHKNRVFMGFLVVFLLFSFTESTMRVQKGMVFFMIFSSLFYWKPTLWSNNRL